MRTLMLLLFASACNTSLAGPTSCADMTCGDSQLCIPARATPDDGGIPAMCVTVPHDCYVHDCVGTDCPTCLQRLCATYPDYIEGTRLVGRELQCP